MTFPSIEAHLRPFPVDVSCDVREVSRSCYYAWLAGWLARAYVPPARPSAAPWFALRRKLVTIRNRMAQRNQP